LKFILLNETCIRNLYFKFVLQSEDETELKEQQKLTSES